MREDRSAGMRRMRREEEDKEEEEEEGKGGARACDACVRIQKHTNARTPTAWNVLADASVSRG